MSILIKEYKLKFILLTLMSIITPLTLLGCCFPLTSFVASPPTTHYYHKDSTFVSASYGLPNIISVQADIWLNKDIDFDAGLVSTFFYVNINSGYEVFLSYSLLPFIRKWFKVGDIPIANIGVDAPIGIGWSFIRRIPYCPPIEFDQGTPVLAFIMGASGFASFGYFSKVFTISLNANLGAGFSTSSINLFPEQSRYYLKASLGLQINITLTRNFGLGVDYVYGLGGGAGGVWLLHPVLRVSLNFPF